MCSRHAHAMRSMLLCTLLVGCIRLCASSSHGTPFKHLSLPPRPRLRFTDTDLQRLRKLIGDGAAADPRAKQLYSNLTSHVDYLLAQPLPTTGNGLMCDAIRDHVYSYGLVYRLTSDKQKRKVLADRCAREMLLVAAMGNWTWRFLSVAETTHALSIG